MVDLLELAADLPVVTLRPGDVLIAQGAVPGPLFVLAEGELTIEHDGVAFASVSTPGAVFGEMSAVLERPATATVRAASACSLHRVEDPISFLTERPGAALEALRIASIRLDTLTRYLTDVKQQYAHLAGHLGMVDGVLNALVHHHPTDVEPGSSRDADLGY